MTPPIVETLHLDQRKLPAEIFQRFSARAGVFRDRRRREEESWENFGKPGRDPDHLGDVVTTIAQRGGWMVNLELARLRGNWKDIVGEAIAMHSVVVGYERGVLTIRAQSMVWATQLTYLIPQLSRTIRQRLGSLEIRDIRVTGPGSQHFGRGHFARRTNG